MAFLLWAVGEAPRIALLFQWFKNCVPKLEPGHQEQFSACSAAQLKGPRPHLFVVALTQIA